MKSAKVHIRKGDGVAATALRNLRLNLPNLCAEVERLIESGPDKGLRGKLPQTPHAKEAIERAIEEARVLNHNRVGTGHILLGLLRESNGVTAQVLMNVGLESQGVRQEVLNLHAAGVEDDPHGSSMYRCIHPDTNGQRSDNGTYRDLPVWQKADELALQVCTLMDKVPGVKTPVVASRVQAIALSIPPQIAHAHERRDAAEKRWFLSIALGSLRQLQYLLEFAQRLECLKTEDCQRLDGLAREIGRVLHTLYGSLVV